MPAMIVTWLTGVTLVRLGQFHSASWLLAKFLLVMALTGVRGFLFRWTKDFAADQNARSQKFYRMINEVPTALMIGIVILVIVKPFSLPHP